MTATRSNVESSQINLIHKPKVFGKLTALNTDFLDNERNVGCKLLYAVIYDYHLFYQKLNAAKADIILNRKFVDDADSFIKQLAVIDAKGGSPALLMPRALRESYIITYGGNCHFSGTPENTEKFMQIIRRNLYKHIIRLVNKNKDSVVPDSLVVSMAFDHLREIANKTVVKANALSPEPMDDIYSLLDRLVNDPLNMLWTVYATAKHAGAKGFFKQHSADEVMLNLIATINATVEDFVFLTDEEQESVVYYDINKACGFIEDNLGSETDLRLEFGL